MTEILSDVRRIHGKRERLWALFHDPEALTQVIPGAEVIEKVADDAFDGILASRIQFMTIRADVEATLADRQEPRHLCLRMHGRPRGLAGTFTVVIDIDLIEAEGRPGLETDLRYVVDLEVTGRLASFGTPILRETLRRQISQLATNVDDFVARDQASIT